MDEPPRASPPTHYWHLWILLAGVIGVGFYCQFLNQTLYQKKAPFFDSLRYYDRLFDVVSLSQQAGMIEAARNAITADSTFCLPYLIAVPCGLILEPSRAIGVWIEVIYFAVFLFSFSAYLRVVWRADSKLIVSCCVPIFLLGALYRSTTGLSDFRVDLPMAFLYVSTACWWLMARVSQRWKHFFLAGLCAGLACLSRGIAPVYLTCGFLPLIVVDLVSAGERSKRLLQILLVLATSIGISLWFYWMQVKFLHFYYVLWNSDANATIAYARTLRHFVAALKSIGPAAAVFFVFVFLFTRNQPGNPSVSGQTLKNRTYFSKDVFWFAWFALSPILLLIVKRADINPYVSLPGAIALIVAWIVSQLHRIQQVVEAQAARFYLASSGLFVVALITGFLDHTKNQPSTAAGHRQVLQVIQQDVQSRESRSASYTTNLLTSLSSASMESMLQYEFDSRFVNETTLVIDGVSYTASHKFLLPSQANWNRTPGETVSEKIMLMEQSAAAEIDYLVAPTPNSIPEIQAQYHYSFSSRFAEPIVRQFQSSGNWVAISESIPIEPGIEVRVWRNLKLPGKVLSE